MCPCHRWTSSSVSSTTTSPLPDDQEALRESHLTYFYDLLKNNGPQLCIGPMTWLSLDPEAEKIVGGRAGLINFLLSDEEARFRVFKDKYICVTDDLAKAIKMNEDETTACKIVDVGLGKWPDIISVL